MDIKDLVQKLTLEEKAHLITGYDAWRTFPIERLNIPSMMVSDGPHGLRKPVSTDGDIAIHESVKAICYPPAVSIASSWDVELAEQMGVNLSKESQHHELGVLLGPGANIKRSPLCGRNFEYFSEDPVLSGQIAGHLIKGIQSTGVSASLKHFVANNQETDRMAVSANVDSRTLREIYAKSFEKAFEVEMPWSVMCAYNRVNGQYVSESNDILTKLLRDELGFTGFVVSDWGAVNKIEDSLNAGVDLEMPGNDLSPQRVIDAIKNKSLSMEILDQAVSRLLEVVMKTNDQKKTYDIDLDKDHQDAIEFAKGCLVLLKNDDNILPLKKDQKTLILGEFAEKPRIQGEGSSMVNPYKVDIPLDSLKSRFESFDYKKGYTIDDEQVNLEALDGINDFEQVVLFIGLPDAYESEGLDRNHLSIPENQQILLSKVTEKHNNVVLVLMNGAVVEISKDMERAKGILEAWLLGEGAAEAIASVLDGSTNPSGKLSETIPNKVSDTPAYLNFPGHNNEVDYREGIFVGYRYFDKKETDLSYPFGHGLSYSSFEYSNLVVHYQDECAKISFDVENISKVDGKEVVQVYLEAPSKAIIREKLSLKAFDKKMIKAGEKISFEFEISKKDMSYYDEQSVTWLLENGQHFIHVGASSRDIRLSNGFEVIALNKRPLTLYDPLKSIVDFDIYKSNYGNLVHKMVTGDLNKPIDMEDQVNRNLYHFYMDMPLIKVINFSKGQFTEEIVQDMLDKINNH